jgi:type VI secretion system protein ImpK
MYVDIANLVHPIVDYGLSLRARLETGAALHLDNERATLKKLLLTERQARRWPDFGGDSADSGISTDAQPFLGIRYALTCWLDELFIRYSNWSDAWAAHTLETDLYGTADGSDGFWRQATIAQARARADALGVFHLCVMLGFRGAFADSPEKTRDWISAAQVRLAANKGNREQPRSEIEPATHVPPLVGRQKLRRLALLGGVTLLVLIPFVVFVAAWGN